MNINEKRQLIADVIVTQEPLQDRHLNKSHSFRALLDNGIT